MKGLKVCCAAMLVTAICGCARRGTAEQAGPAGPEVATRRGPAGRGRFVPSEPPRLDLTGKRVLIIVAPKDFRDEEFEKPYEILGSAGAKITVGSLRRGECTGVGGTKVQATVTPPQVRVADYDAVVFVGGPGMVKHVGDPALIKLAKDFAAARKVIGAICVAPVILARAGLLKGIEATVWPDMKQELVGRGVAYVGEDVVVRGPIVTASGPGAAEAFGGALAAALATPGVGMPQPNSETAQ